MPSRDLILRPLGTAPTPQAGDDPHSVPDPVERMDDAAREVLESGSLLSELVSARGERGGRVLADRAGRIWVAVDLLAHLGATPVIGPIASRELGESILESAVGAAASIPTPPATD